MNKNILLCGVGGQGTVLASKLIALAAMACDIPVMSAETIGMAQKGGSVTSHLRLGGGVYTPMLAKGEADVIIGFEPAETVRALPFLKPDGVVVTNTRPIIPVNAALTGSAYSGNEMIDYLRGSVRRLVTVDCAAACDALGSPKVLNMVLLGAALNSGALELDKYAIKAALARKVAPRLYELDCRALDYVGSTHNNAEVRS